MVEMATFSTGGEELVCYATSMGKLAGLDLRSGKPAWELSNSSKFGEAVARGHLIYCTEENFQEGKIFSNVYQLNFQKKGCGFNP